MMAMTDALPPMTDPLSVYWRQPPRDEILIDDAHAVLSSSNFVRLSEYSSTVPTGVYVGKAWRCWRKGDWWLRWYADHPTDPGLCSILERRLLVVDDVTKQP